MEIIPAATQGLQVIQSYGDGGFTVSNIRYAGSVLVFPERTLAWGPKDFAALTVDHLFPLSKAPEPLELVLIGAGGDLGILPDELIQVLRGAELGVEVMNTGAACRTFNVLQSEQRHVAAALIAVA
jgi:uncharacterized protein